MEVSSYQSPNPRDIPMCAAPDVARSFFSIKYSELAGSKYRYFLYGFKDEQDFEDFKQDLRDFQKLRNEFYGAVLLGSDDRENWLDLKEELQFIRRPNDVCKNRRRGHGSKSTREVCQKPAFNSKSGKKPSSKILVPVSCEETCSGSTKYPKDCQKEAPKIVIKDIPASSCLPGSCERSSGLSEFDRNLAVRSSIRSFLMEFLNGDEHFQEFERVFEKVNNQRGHEDLDTSNLKMSLDIGSGPRVGSTNDNTSKSTVQEPLSKFDSNVFADFFDNDETFLEFEKEFEKFRSNRRSNLSGSINSLGSSRDIFGDIKTFCERNIKSTSASLMSVNSCSSQDEATPSCGDDALQPDLVWRSVEDWEKILRKMRRNSRLLLDTCCHAHNHHHRHSALSARSQEGIQSDAYQKTQSLADLRVCHGNGNLTNIPSRNSPSGNKWTRSSQSVSGLPRRSSLSSTHSQEVAPPDRRSNSPSISVILSGSDCDSSSGRWSETDEDDTRYSSSSTLCSDNGDTNYSFSCSCCSDIHDSEDTDDDITLDCVPTRTRSQSLMELPSQMRPNYLGLQASSTDNLHPCDKLSLGGNGRIDVRFRDLSSVGTNTGKRGDMTYLDDDTPTDDDGSIFSGVSPPSTVSAQLSDAESEHYHTASSDLSDHYSTAKSDLSNFVNKHGAEIARRSTGIDLSDLCACSAADTSDRVLEWARQGQHINEGLQSIPKEPYHSYHGREARAMNNSNRRLSGSACQYTCHQHCVPAVTLNCKSICDDGYGAAAAARTPSPSDPRSHLETSLSIGNISRLPGCARIVPDLSNNTPSAVIPQAPRVSEPVPDSQHKVQGRSGSVCAGSSIAYSDLSQGHTDTPRAANVPAHHQLSRSASEGFVIVPSPPVSQPALSSNPNPHPSQGQHISSPPQQPSLPSPNSRPGSLQRTHTHTQSHIKTALQNQELPSTASSDKSTQEITSVSESTDNIQQLQNGSEDTASDLQDIDANHESTTEKDETDSGYRSGTIPDDKLPRAPSQATLDRQELSRKIAKYNHFVPAASLEVTEKESFQGFVKVTMNLIRPITMELGARPPSIYELLTREHIVEENTQHVAFYMPRDTHKSLHISSDITTKEVVTSLLKKFHILDHPRKFAMYEQEFNDRNKLVRLRRLTDKDFPLRAILGWDPERIRNYRMVLQENETGEIVWDVFSLPELGNFLKVLDREEKETILELKHKYAYMRQYMERRLTELRSERIKQS